MQSEQIIPADEIGTIPETKYGPIPENLKDAIKQSGVKLQDVWGMSLDPREPFNPEKGSYYIGIVEKTNEECLAILAMEKQVLGRLQDLPVAKSFSVRLDQISEGDMEGFKQEGYKAITDHEETHKVQNIRLNSRMVLLEGLGVLNDIRRSNTTVTAAETELFNAHHKAYLLTEVQALSAQARFDPTTNPERNDFMTYWMSKTFRLFEKRGSVTNLEIIYDKFADHNTDFSSIPNADGLISRALLLSRDPKMIDHIQNGEITFEAFQESVTNGLDEFINNPGKFYSSIRNPDFMASLDTELMKSLDKLAVETHKYAR
jgi:hypothetical protein